MSYNGSSSRNVVSLIAFKTNECQQLSFDDSFIVLTGCEKKDLEKIILITDGDYGGQDNIAPAIEKNVHLVTIALIRKEAPNVLADFEFNEDDTRLLKCTACHVPISQNYTKSTRQSRVSFDRNHCEGCPYQEQCHPKIYKKVTTFMKAEREIFLWK